MITAHHDDASDHHRSFPMKVRKARIHATAQQPAPNDTLQTNTGSRGCTNCASAVAPHGEPDSQHQMMSAVVSPAVVTPTQPYARLRGLLSVDVVRLA